MTKEEIIENLKEGIQICKQSNCEFAYIGWVQGLLKRIDKEENNNE